MYYIISIFQLPHAENKFFSLWDNFVSHCNPGYVFVITFQKEMNDLTDMTQRVKMDLNKRSFPEQMTIKTLKYNPQGFKITIN